MIKAAVFQEKLNRYKEGVLIALLIIFYSVGIFGLSTEAYREEFLSLTFFNLSLSFVILLFGRLKHTKSFYLFVAFTFFIGMSAELIGVHTSLLFGEYTYGESLGIKFFDVPIIIGVNWIMLTIISASVAQHLKSPWWIKALLATVLMLFLDILIEPVAIVSDYWTWQGEIPFSNYLTWFLITLFLHLIYFRFKLAEKNKVGVALYIIQFMFFLILNLTI